MKQSRFVVAFLAAILSANTGLSLLACDKCDSNGKACGPCCNDRGLLDMLAGAAGRLRPPKSLLALAKPCSCDACQPQPTCGCENRPACGCEMQPTCGCEARPTCGFEIPATCGCEMSPSCGCESQPACGCEIRPTNVFPGEITGAAKLMLQPQGSGVRQPHPQLPTPNLRSAPTRAPAPLPDALVDPFSDDTATRVRRLPARPVAATRTMPVRQFNSQAKHVIHRQLSDDAIDAAVPSTLEVASSSRAHRTVTGNSQNSLSDNPPSRVITASGDVPRAIYSSGNSLPQRLPPRTQVADQPVNPLRGN